MKKINDWVILFCIQRTEIYQKSRLVKIAYNNTVEHRLLLGVFNLAVTRISKAMKQTDDNNDNDLEH